MTSEHWMRNLGKVGIIFNGGGFSGAYSVGFLKAIWERDIRPSYVQGVSVGALTGGALAMNGPEETEKLWLETEERGASRVFNWSNIPGNVLRKKGSLFNNDGILELINKFDYPKIINSKIELQIVTCNESLEGETTVFRNHDEKFKANPDLFRKVILASAAIPGILPPVEIDGELHSDGVYFSLEPMVSAGCDTIFLLLNDQTDKAERWDQRLAQSRHRLYERAAMAELKEILNKHPDFEFYKSADLDLKAKNIPSLVRKMMSAARSISQGDDLNFVPHRIISFYSQTSIDTLYTTGFKKGDIKASIEIGHFHGKELLGKILG